MLQSRLNVVIETMSAPSIPPITTAAIAIGVSTQIIPPCATVGLNGSRIP